jgi:hypothetical protein
MYAVKIGKAYESVECFVKDLKAIIKRYFTDRARELIFNSKLSSLDLTQKAEK